jgi:hypothetical protein
MTVILKELELYLKEFFSTYINELRIMREKNFTSVENILESYKTNLYIAANINFNSDGYVNSLTYAIVKNPYTNRAEFVIHQSTNDIIDEDNFLINTQFGPISIKSFNHISITEILEKNRIQTWCYEKLEKDIMTSLQNEEMEQNKIL